MWTAAKKHFYFTENCANVVDYFHMNWCTFGAVVSIYSSVWVCETQRKQHQHHHISSVCQQSRPHNKSREKTRTNSDCVSIAARYVSFLCATELHCRTKTNTTLPHCCTVWHVHFITINTHAVVYSDSVAHTSSRCPELAGASCGLIQCSPTNAPFSPVWVKQTSTLVLWLCQTGCHV